MKPQTGSLMVKICGITSLEDAAAAVEAGADLLGFNFYSASPRYIEPVHCQVIIAGLKERGLHLNLIGVFVNAPLEQIRTIMQSCDLHRAQLSGDEPPEVLDGLQGRGYKALRVKDAEGLQSAQQRYPIQSAPPAYLIDAYRPGEYGGTGQTADWSLAAELSSRVPILLAGGLTAENVAQAVSQVRPWGVDVASGVESAPGIKDHHKMRRFIQQARGERLC
jgi:phosphoribosylanthranilate isomerase